MRFGAEPVRHPDAFLNKRADCGRISDSPSLSSRPDGVDAQSCSTTSGEATSAAPPALVLTGGHERPFSRVDDRTDGTVRALRKGRARPGKHVATTLVAARHASSQ
ncbi:hypothetical protein MRX96_004436 [Rhipicephalus microplus]